MSELGNDRGVSVDIHLHVHFSDANNQSDPHMLDEVVIPPADFAAAEKAFADHLASLNKGRTQSPLLSSAQLSEELIASGQHIMVSVREAVAATLSRK